METQKSGFCGGVRRWKVNIEFGAKEMEELCENERCGLFCVVEVKKIKR